MNFNLILILFFLTACGLKGDPIAPKSHALPSIIEDHKDIQLESELDETKKP